MYKIKYHHRITNIFLSLMVIVMILGFSLTNACAQTSNYNLPKYENPTGSEFPINAWYSFSKPEMITKENFIIMHEAGFNMTNTLTDFKIAEMTLEAVEGTGVKVLVNTGQTRNIEKVPAYLPKLKNNKNVAGLFISDEPNASKFQQLKEGVAVIRKYDSDILTFVNFFPDITASRLGTPDYKTYLLKGIYDIGLSMFSYDNYPITKRGSGVSISDTFFENLEIAAEVSKEVNRPFWAFCLSAPHYNYASPTVAYLTFEAFSALAYGAQGLSYYTYVQKEDKNPKYSSAPVLANGKRTKIWEYCKTVNTQIHNLENIFLGCNFKGAWHTGKIPKGCKPLGTLPEPFLSISYGKEGVLVSKLTNNGKEYLIIVNHSVTNSQDIKLSSVKPMKRYLGDGTISESGRSVEFKLSAGGYAIFSCD